MKQGWEIKKLGEVCEIQGGSTPKRTESSFWDNGTYPWFTIEDIREQGHIILDTKQKITKVAWDKMRIFPKDTILLCCTASLGEYAITQIPLSSNQQFNGLMIKDRNYLSPMYLMHYCSTLKNTLLSLSGKATIDFVSAEKVRQIPISIPPLVEQEKIVEELDCLSGVIEKKKQQLKELDALAQSIFYTMFGDPITNEKGWEVKKLGEVCEDKKKIFRASKKCALDDVINYIDISAIDNINNVINIPTPYIFEEAPSRAQQVVRLGDVIVSMVRPNLKNIAIVNCNYDNLIASSGFCVLRARKEMTIPFLFYIVKSDAFTMYLMDRVSGANYPAVRESDITDYISIIPPITLQQGFADKIEAIEKQKELIKQSITETEELFNSRMDYYFG